MKLKIVLPIMTALLVTTSFSPIARAQQQQQQQQQANNSTTADSMFGRYEGTAKSKSRGNIPVVMQIKLDSEKIVGMMNTPLGDFRIIDGSHKEGLVNIKFSAGDEVGTITAEYKDGSLTGNFSLSDDSGTISLKKTGAATTETPDDHSCNAMSAKILILGTYHMNNPELDAKNIEADDVLLSRRQGEIAELIDKLARYKPTKIAIEAPYRSANWTDLYKKYLAGQHQLGRNEIEQIGFQLAKRLNLPTLYPVDFPMFMNGLTPSEIEYQKPSQTNADNTKSNEPPSLSEEDKLLRRSTVTEFLRYLNTEERIQNDHAQYMKMLFPNEDAAIYRRTDLVTNWYKRNLRIFTNINRITEFPGDRILLIIGAGHLKILRDLAADSHYFCLLKPETYLK